MLKKIREAWHSPWKALLEIISLIVTPFVYLVCDLNKIKIGRGAKFYGIPIFLRHRQGSISIGNHFENRNLWWSNPLGVNHPTIFSSWNEMSKIEIGDNVGISGGSIVAFKKIVIGDDTLIGANCTITDTDFHPVNSSSRRYSKNNINSSEINIGKNVFVGMNVTILKGVTIGDNSVVGANSLVISNLPKNIIAGGIPAREISKIKFTK